MKKYYLPSGDAKRLAWLRNFAHKLNNYVETYGIDKEVAECIGRELKFLEQVQGYNHQFKAFLKSLAKYKNSLMNGGAAVDLPIIPAPELEDLGVAAGIFIRIGKLVTTIKSHEDYTEKDGIDMGIIGAEAARPDAETHRPELDVRIGSGGFPEIIWHKGQMNGIELHTKGDNGEWQFLAMDTMPNYRDTRALPPAGHPVKRSYRAIYSLKDARFGQWSEEVTVTVG